MEQDLLIGVDVGYGHVKVSALKDDVVVKEFKFPTWIGVWKNYTLSDVAYHNYQGEKWVVGEDAKYSSQRVVLIDYEDLINYLPIIIQEVLRRLNIREKGNHSITIGLSPADYTKYKNDEQAKKMIQEMGLKVSMQGLGALYYLMVNNLISLKEDEDTLVIDIGFKTIDVVLAAMKNGKTRNIAINTINNVGLLLAVESFKYLLPKEFDVIKNLSNSRLVEVFEKGFAEIGGEVVNLQEYKDMAIEKYKESIFTRIKEEYGNYVWEVKHLIVVGGGAYFVKDLKRNTIVPQNPEFVNARGFAIWY